MSGARSPDGYVLPVPLAELLGAGANGARNLTATLQAAMAGRLELFVAVGGLPGDLLYDPGDGAWGMACADEVADDFAPVGREIASALLRSETGVLRHFALGDHRFSLHDALTIRAEALFVRAEDYRSAVHGQARGPLDGEMACSIDGNGLIKLSTAQKIIAVLARRLKSPPLDLLPTSGEMDQSLGGARRTLQWLVRSQQSVSSTMVSDGLRNWLKPEQLRGSSAANVRNYLAWAAGERPPLPSPSKEEAQWHIERGGIHLLEKARRSGSTPALTSRHRRDE